MFKTFLSEMKYLQIYLWARSRSSILRGLVRNLIRDHLFFLIGLLLGVCLLPFFSSKFGCEAHVFFWGLCFVWVGVIQCFTLNRMCGCHERRYTRFELAWNASLRVHSLNF